MDHTDLFVGVKCMSHPLGIWSRPETGMTLGRPCLWDRAGPGDCLSAGFSVPGASPIGSGSHVFGPARLSRLGAVIDPSSRRAISLGTATWRHAARTSVLHVTSLPMGLGLAGFAGCPECAGGGFFCPVPFNPFMAMLGYRAELGRGSSPVKVRALYFRGCCHACMGELVPDPFRTRAGCPSWLLELPAAVER